MDGSLHADRIPSCWDLALAQTQTRHLAPGSPTRNYRLDRITRFGVFCRLRKLRLPVVDQGVRVKDRPFGRFRPRLTRGSWLRMAAPGRSVAAAGRKGRSAEKKPVRANSKFLAVSAGVVGA